MKNIRLFYCLLACVGSVAFAANNASNNSYFSDEGNNFVNNASNNTNNSGSNKTNNFANSSNTTKNTYKNNTENSFTNNATAPKNNVAKGGNAAAPTNNFTNNATTAGNVGAAGNATNAGNGSLEQSLLQNGSSSGAVPPPATNFSSSVPATNIPTNTSYAPSANSSFTTAPSATNSTMTANGQATAMQASAVVNTANKNGTVVPDAEKSQVEKQITDETKRRLEQDLDENCHEYCRLLSLTPSVEEVFDTSSAQLGFENTSNTVASRRFNTKDVSAEVLMDERYGSENIERLKKLFAKLQEQYPYHVSFKWSKVAFPDSGNTAKSEAQVKEEFNDRVRNELESIILSYCPHECEIHSVNAAVARANMDEVRDGKADRYLFVRDGKGALYVTGVDTKVSINSLMVPSRKLRIQNLLRQQLQAYGVVHLNVSEIPFPKPAEEVQKDLDQTRNDPWGLEKLGRALDIFKEHANVKEIYKESSSSSSLASEKSNNNKELNSKSELSSSSENKSEHSAAAAAWSNTTLMILGGALLLIIIAGAFGLRYVSTGKRMQEIVLEGMNSPHTVARGMTQMGNMQPMMAVSNNDMGQAPAPVLQMDSMRMRLGIQELKDELLQTFSTQPKIARDIFTRVIRENGIEFAAKCVVIFGDVIVFDLLGDEELKQDLATLAEYVHVNAPVVTEEETAEILRHLKLKVTAGKIRLKTQRSLDIFDFLKTKSAQQIFELIFDESPRSQSIVLTQLQTEKRRAVFDLFEGQSKVDLLRELSSGDVVPKEYLQNVAHAFKRKAMSSLKFDGENVRGSDVLLELLERLDLSAQRELMVELDQSNADTAWLLRSRLVTIETLPFIKDGILVDIFLTLDPMQMAILLAGTREHIRNFVFQKAPHDIANAWAEYLESMRSVDPESYKLAEMQVLAKLRSLAANGTINLMDINNSIYPSARSAGQKVAGNKNIGERTFKISNPLVA